MASIRIIVPFCVLAVAISMVVCVPMQSKQPQQQQQPQEEERLPIGPDGSLFLSGTECGPDEVLAHGSVPTCEPTCSNPRPVCPKVFFSGLDYVPCFCKKPLVRNEQTKQCVLLADCPPAATKKIF